MNIMIDLATDMGIPGYDNEDINDEELLKMMMSRIKNEE